MICGIRCSCSLFWGGGAEYFFYSRVVLDINVMFYITRGPILYWISREWPEHIHRLPRIWGWFRVFLVSHARSVWEMIVELLIRSEETVTLNISIHYLSPQIIKISSLYHFLEIILALPIYSNVSHIVCLLSIIWVLEGTTLGTRITEVFIHSIRNSQFRTRALFMVES